MPNGAGWLTGQIVRLTTRYMDAERGIYTVVYVYSNGWLGLASQRDGRCYDAPAHICRLIAPGARLKAQSPPSAASA